MVYSKRQQIPGAEEVWDRVVTYAVDCLQNDRPVFTVDRRIENRITDVKEGSIGRSSKSPRATTNTSRITRGNVASLWAEIQDGRKGSDYPYFTKALVLAALPGVVEDFDGRLVIRNDPAVIETKRRRVASFGFSHGNGGGEGEVHRKLKEFIYHDPDNALASLDAGPFQQVAMEYVFPTGDRVDVVLIDGSGCLLLVEVKPILHGDDLTPFAQAAKYRILWSILREVPISEIRCLVVAPDISLSPWKAMKEKYQIECASVDFSSGVQGRRP
jgi:hypothetical protein